MPELHIHATQSKVHISGDKLTMLESAIRVILFGFFQALILWVSAHALTRWGLLPRGINYAEAVAIVGVFFALGEAWRGGKN